VFYGTIKENIKYNSYHANDDDIRDACEKAEALKFIL
jgi:ABC-type multidrug transport system fused ATPase/permease subunit